MQIPPALGRQRPRPSLLHIYSTPSLPGVPRPARLGGACGACEYRALCGGCRARAYAATGDPLAEEPDCAYEPDGSWRAPPRTRASRAPRRKPPDPAAGCRMAVTAAHPCRRLACSGSSNVAQLANAIAVRLDRSGVAGHVVHRRGGRRRQAARSEGNLGRRIVVIDGCPLGCCEAALSRHDVTADSVVRLHERGLRKRQHVDFEPEERDEVFAEIVADLEPVLAQPPATVVPARRSAWEQPPPALCHLPAGVPSVGSAGCCSPRSSQPGRSWSSEAPCDSRSRGSGARIGRSAVDAWCRPGASSRSSNPSTARPRSS